MLSRFVNYHPEKLLTCAFLSVPYIAPGQAWDIDALKPVTEELLGFEKYGYMRFMVRDDSWKIMEAHVRRSFLPQSLILRLSFQVGAASR